MSSSAPGPRAIRVAVALLMLATVTGGSARAAQPHHVPAHAAAVAVQRTKHVLVRGYLVDPHPATDGELQVYSKTHNTTTTVAMTPTTLVKLRTQTVPRSRLQYKMRVIVTCSRGNGGTLTAITVHIERGFLTTTSKRRKK